MRKPFIICTDGEDVIFGFADKRPKVGSATTIYEARMILRWPTEHGGLFGLAANGPTGDTRITSSVKMTGNVPRRWLSVSPVAAKEIGKWPDF